MNSTETKLQIKNKQQIDYSKIYQRCVMHIGLYSPNRLQLNVLCTLFPDSCLDPNLLYISFRKYILL